MKAIYLVSSYAKASSFHMAVKIFDRGGRNSSVVGDYHCGKGNQITIFTVLNQTGNVVSGSGLIVECTGFLLRSRPYCEAFES